ncbi:MAG: pyruvate:ferredoxin (flavodoxin) oxidoreductase, homodimeric [Bacillota bacterium]|jgi:pyruvate-ferredoxin/flavodoxin oxidoreductase|nr:pyruvate:ferredoxin (flavodoxin) oxidoreductase, homodimeric [Bacillota bacterium]
MKKQETMDGNQAASYAAYAMTEVASIFPITPSTAMAESVDEWSASGKKNIFGQSVKVVEMQSETGAVAAMRGALQSGALASTYTASQGLLMMIPNLYKMAGELLPGVVHVTARAIATHALSIYGDHQDVMACRQTGISLLASSNVQEVMDLGIISHLSAIKSRVPFLHFFDGFRTSHEYQKIEVIPYEDINKMIDFEAVKAFRERSLNPERPVARGTTQNPDIYFQQRESANPFFNAVPDIVQGYMDELAEITGRKYKLFDYYGAKDAEFVIIAMGSVCDTIHETIDYLLEKGEKAGVVKVRLYRPFSQKHFLDALPDTVKRIAVLDRTKEPGAPGEPLYLDVVKALKSNHSYIRTFREDNEYDQFKHVLTVGGRYGLSSKDTTPSQMLAVYRNLKQEKPKDGFTVGIIDDVTNTSLPEERFVNTVPAGTKSCKIYGLGSDGTVGANKAAAKIIGDNTDLKVQAYFSYDSKKSGGTTVSHLRFGKLPIRSPYLVNNADYIACHNQSFVYQYDLLKGLKRGGTFVLNCTWAPHELEEKLPAYIRRTLAENEIRFYTINALEIASELGLGNRINMVMQAVFFKLADIIPVEEALGYLKKSIEKMYGRKGAEIVNKNTGAVDRAIEALHEVPVPTEWKNAVKDVEEEPDIPEFVSRIQRPMARHEGDELPVSAFKGMEDGTYPLGTTAYEKRGIAPNVPEWQIDKCIQCGRCVYICPHATIRAFLVNDEEAQRKPDTFKTKEASAKGLGHMGYRIQVSPLDCTGCGNCADICPAKGKALIMKPADQEIEMESDNWDFATTLTEKSSIVDRKTILGSQFVKPLLEFNGACPGCGETPYIRLLTQLFGRRMLISNATGCSSIWGAYAPSIAYTTDEDGRGPAWINPLFEDAAEFGYGLALGSWQIRERLAVLMEQACNMDITVYLKERFQGWIKHMYDGEGSEQAAKEILDCEHEMEGNSVLAEILKLREYLVKPSVWSIGGDGWAYDIGYGGLDHVIASGDDINLFVMDTEIYSNTGGQASKSTQTGAVAKLAAGGKSTRKKDLGLMAMTYGNVYVAQIAMGADMNQTMKAILEAERYQGPSLIIAYSPCVSHGIKSGMGTSIMEEKRAVESGYWQLYRFNPDLRKEGKNPFTLDSKPPTQDYKEFLQGEIRYAQLQNIFPERAEELFERSKDYAQNRNRIKTLLSENEIF